MYYYITNLQGDVMQIVDSNGTTVATYEYDPYGFNAGITGTFGYSNPIRYRGYVYDHETTLYYINSRYYDPSVGRFVSADALISTGQGLLGNNMFAYCRNNPVCRIDITGYADEEADLGGETKDDLFPDPMGGGGDSQPSGGYVQIMYDGYPVKYSFYLRDSNHINIGTYYFAVDIR